MRNFLLPLSLALLVLLGCGNSATNQPFSVTVKTIETKVVRDGIANDTILFVVTAKDGEIVLIPDVWWNRSVAPGDAISVWTTGEDTHHWCKVLAVTKKGIPKRPS